jgi:hypothetical protein
MARASSREGPREVLKVLDVLEVLEGWARVGLYMMGLARRHRDAAERV